jgi:hypothetical protein
MPRAQRAVWDTAAVEDWVFDPLSAIDSNCRHGNLVEESFRQLQAQDQEMSKLVLIGARHLSS